MLRACRRLRVLAMRRQWNTRNTPSRMAPYLAPGNVPTIRFLEEAGHFVQNEAPERVNQAMLEWLGAPARPAKGRSA